MRSHTPTRPKAIAAAHRCPTCDTWVSPGHVLCAPCWKSIPTVRRDVLRATFRRRTTDPDLHEAACALTRDLATIYARRKT